MTSLFLLYIGTIYRERDSRKPQLCIIPGDHNWIPGCYANLSNTPFDCCDESFSWLFSSVFLVSVLPFFACRFSEFPPIAYTVNTLSNSSILPFSISNYFLKLCFIRLFFTQLLYLKLYSIAIYSLAPTTSFSTSLFRTFLPRTCFTTFHLHFKRK